jgi:uncharacterized membrane protein
MSAIGPGLPFNFQPKSIRKPMDPLHPTLAHFPLALLLVSVVFDVFGYLLKRPALHFVAFWNLLVGVLGGGAAAYSGFLEERELLGSKIPADLMSSHREAGLAALAIFGLLLLLRLFRGWRDPGFGRRLGPLYLAAAILAGFLLTSAGRSGTRLVFEAAVGVMAPESPRVSVLPDAGASRQAVWVFGVPKTPIYGRPRVTPGVARLRAAFYLRSLVPGKPLLRVRNGCKLIHIPLLHDGRPVAHVRIDPETGELLTRNEARCLRSVKLLNQVVLHRLLPSLREVRVGPTAWQGGHGAYWNVPLLKSGRMVDILRISVRDGTVIPLATESREGK